MCRSHSVYMYTLKRISNWPLYKTRYYATHLINASKVRFHCIVHAFIRSLLLVHNRANLGMMLARDYVSCHGARSTLVMIVGKQRAKRLDLNPIRPLVRPLETQGSCTTAATKSQGTEACYSSDVCGHSTTA